MLLKKSFTGFILSLSLLGALSAFSEEPTTIRCPGNVKRATLEQGPPGVAPNGDVFPVELLPDVEGGETRNDSYAEWTHLYEVSGQPGLNLHCYYTQKYATTQGFKGKDFLIPVPSSFANGKCVFQVGKRIAYCSKAALTKRKK
jgi:hypothetical protein